MADVPPLLQADLSLHSLSETSEQGTHLCLRIEKLLVQRGDGGEAARERYRLLVESEGARVARLRRCIDELEDADRDARAGCMGPLLHSLPSELAGGIAVLGGGASRMACAAMRSLHDEHATELRTFRMHVPRVPMDQVVIRCRRLRVLRVEGAVPSVLLQLRSAAARCGPRLVGLALRMPYGPLQRHPIRCAADIPGALACLAALESLRLERDAGPNPASPSSAEQFGRALAPAIRALGRLTQLDLWSVPEGVVAQLPPLPLPLLSLTVYATTLPLPLLQPPALPRTLTSLSLVQCRIHGPERVAALAAALVQLPGLQHLRIGNGADDIDNDKNVDRPDLLNDFADSAAALAPALRGLGGLRSLVMDGCGIDPVGGDALGPALAALTGLQLLDLGTNNLGHRGVVAAVAKLTGLRTLRLPDCGITDAGAIALAEALKGMRRLEHVSLWTNAFCDAAITLLVSAAAAHGSLKSVDILSGELGAGTEEVLRDIVGPSCKLT